MSTTTPSKQQQSSSSYIKIQNCNTDITACTFSIRNEDHTLGNVLRHTLIQNTKNIEFAGYSVPHPSEPIVQLRIQTIQQSQPSSTNKQHRSTCTSNDRNTVITAPKALQNACNTIIQQCDVLLEKLESILPYVQDDRIEMEQYNTYDDDDDDDEEVFEDVIEDAVAEDDEELQNDVDTAAVVAVDDDNDDDDNVRMD